MDVVKELIFFLLVIIVGLQKEVNLAAIPNKDVTLNEITNFILPEDENLENIPQSQKNNLYTSRTENEIVPYVVQLNRNYIKFQTTGFDAETVALTPVETEGIQRLSLALVELLNESQLSSPSNDTEKLNPKTLNPIITISNLGIFLRFVNIPEEIPEGNHVSQGQRHIIWKFVSEFAKNIFEDKLKHLNLTGTNEVQFDFPVESSTDDLKQFENFIATLWKIMKLSVKYAEANFKGWTTSLPILEAKSKLLDAAVLEYEALSPKHIFRTEEKPRRHYSTD